MPCYAFAEFFHSIQELLWEQRERNLNYLGVLLAPSSIPSVPSSILESPEHMPVVAAFSSFPLLFPTTSVRLIIGADLLSAISASAKQLSADKNFSEQLIFRIWADTIRQHTIFAEYRNQPKQKNLNLVEHYHPLHPSACP